jgi:BON domain
MLTSAISSAARLSLAPAKLAGRMAGSLLGGRRGNGAADGHPAAAPSRAQPTRRTRSQARPKRATTSARAKTQSKRTATTARAKTQPKRAAARTRTKAQPRRAPEPKPLDDVTIARKVESIIFRDVDVDKGKVDVNVAERVVWLRGEVQTQELRNELEARAARVTEVRRVENLLHLPETPAPGRTETPAAQPEPAAPIARPEGRPGTPGEAGEGLPGRDAEKPDAPKLG